MVAFSNSCEVTRSTKQVVDGCPDSEEKWRKRAAIKNCAAFASQCAEPERLVYHCVINHYVNQTLEVCAYAQYILSGKVFSLQCKVLLIIAPLPHLQQVRNEKKVNKCMHKIMIFF